MPFYQRRQHRNWRFRGFASRQRADAMTINRMVGQCVDHDWDLVQNRLEPGGSRARRTWRREHIVGPYNMDSRVIAWGLGGFSHTRPWAPVPRQVFHLELTYFIASMNIAAATHRVIGVEETNTSQVCPIHGAGYENGVPNVDHNLLPVQKWWYSCPHR
jgi:hypothetical protein